MQLIAIATRIQISTSYEHKCLQHIEDTGQIVLILDRGQDDGNPSGGEDGVVIAGGNEAECGALLARGAIISVQSYKRLARHSKSLREWWNYPNSLAGTRGRLPRDSSES